MKSSTTRTKYVTIRSCYRVQPDLLPLTFQFYSPSSLPFSTFDQLGHISIFLQDYEDAESWAYLDKLICQWRKEEEKVRKDCGDDPAPPYGRCELFRNQKPSDEWLQEEAASLKATNQTTAPVTSPVERPSPAHDTVESQAPTTEVTPEPTEATPSPSDSTAKDPTNSPSKSPTESGKDGMQAYNWPETKAPSSSPIEATESPSSTFKADGQEADGEWTEPPKIDCKSDKFDGINFSRMCSSNKACCEETMSSTSFCWESYDFLESMGVSRASACYHCCDEPKKAGNPKPEKEGLPKTIQCSAVENAYRMCKAGSCCESERSDSSFCKTAYSRWTDNQIEQI